MSGVTIEAVVLVAVILLARIAPAANPPSQPATPDACAAPRQ